MRVGTLVKYVGSACWNEDFGLVITNPVEVVNGITSIYWFADSQVHQYTQEELRVAFENTVEIISGDTEV